MSSGTVIDIFKDEFRAYHEFTVYLYLHLKLNLELNHEFTVG